MTTIFVNFAVFNKITGIISNSYTKSLKLRIKQ